MNVDILNKADLSKILYRAINSVSSGSDWDSVFPKIKDCIYFIPGGYEDLEEHSDLFRGSDHVIANKTVKHSDLHPIIVKLIKTIICRNIIADEVFLADIFEHAGTHYATELALYDRVYIRLYADFLFSNDICYERFQHFDFVRIIRKQDWCSETYYLLFAHLFSQSKYFHDDIDYLNYNGYPLHKGFFDNRKESDLLITSLGDFLEEIVFDISNEEINAFGLELFGKLIDKHIYPSKEDKEKAEALKARYQEVIQRLQTSKPKEEISLPIERLSHPVKRIKIGTSSPRKRI